MPIVMPAHEMRPDIVDLLPDLYAYALRAKSIVELGCGNLNGSTLAFAQGLKDGEYVGDRLIVSVDQHPHEGLPADPDWYLGYPYLAALGFWHYEEGDTRDRETFDGVREYFLMRPGNRCPDILYIDTDHTYKQMAAECALWLPFVGPETLVLAHDTWMCGQYNEMTDALKEACAAILPETHEYVDLRKDSNGLGALMPKAEEARVKWAIP